MTSRPSFPDSKVVTIVAAVIGVALSFLAYHHSWNRIEEHRRLEFQWASTNYRNLLASGMEAAFDETLDAHDHFEAYGQVSQKVFQAFADAIMLRNEERLDNLFWIPRVSRQARASFEQEWAAEIPGFRIQGDGPARPSATLHPLLFAHSSQDFRYPLGYDLESIPAIDRAMKEAVESHDITLAVLPGFTAKNPSEISLLALLPVRELAQNAPPRRSQEKIAGFVAGLFHLRPLVDAILERLVPRGIDIWIQDPEEGKAPLLFRASRLRMKPPRPTAATATPEPDAGGDSYYLPLPAANRSWKLITHPTDRFSAVAMIDVAPLVVLLAGLLLTGLLVAYLLHMQREMGARIQAQTALKESEARFRSVAETAQDAIVAFDDQDKILFWNRSAETTFGYHQEEIIGQLFSLLIPNKLQDRPEILVNFLQNPPGESWGALECQGRHKKGYTFPLDLTLASWEEGKGRVYSAVIRDITDRKRNEQLLFDSREQLRNFTGHLHSVREDEQKRIAGEIHDELGSILTRMRMDLALLKRRLDQEGEEELQEKVSAINDLSGMAIQAIRRIAASLRPKILDQFGLLAALQWQAREFEEHFKIPCRVSEDSVNIRMDDKRETALFRIGQEALTNIARHAKAEQVDITLKLEQNQVILCVTDDGVGMTEESIMKSDTQGIRGMNERTRQFKGTLHFTRGRKKGTVMEAAIPSHPADRIDDT